jgi:hypothetical protein
MIRVTHTYTEIGKGIKVKDTKAAYYFSLLSYFCIIEGSFVIKKETYSKMLKLIKKNFPESNLDKKLKFVRPIHKEKNLEIYKYREFYYIRYINRNLDLMITSDSEQKVKDLANWLVSNT